MAHTRDYDVEKKRWRWTYHLFRGVMALCVLYVAGSQVIERASRNAALPPPAALPLAKALSPAPVAEVPPALPPLAAEASPAAAASPQPPEVVQAPPRPAFRVLGGVNGRAGPGVEFRVVRLITSDVVLVATGERLNNWIEVFVRGGPEDQKFWVSRNLMLPEPQ